MVLNDATRSLASRTLRGWATDESLQERVLGTPGGAAIAFRLAQRYVAGEEAQEALDAVRAAVARGHLGSVERRSEPALTEAQAQAETLDLQRLTRVMTQALSRPMLLVDPALLGARFNAELATHNTLRVAKAAAAVGTRVAIRAQDARDDEAALAIALRVARDYPETGLTLRASNPGAAAALASLPTDLGPVRLELGESAATGETGPARALDGYLDLTHAALRSQRSVILAVHDRDLVAALRKRFRAGLKSRQVELEIPQGLRPDLLDDLRAAGHHTRQRVVYGPRLWSYVLHCMAEQPERAVLALADLQALR